MQFLKYGNLVTELYVDIEAIMYCEIKLQKTLDI